jgi:hypothetical protein
VTKEQWIIVGLLAAAFVAGWVARAVSGRRDRSQRGAETPVVFDQHLERAVEATRKELDRAIRSHLAALALSYRARRPRKIEAEADALAEEVSAALQDDAANECMQSVMNGSRGVPLSERELDLADWGFAYGVAWARARERGSDAPGDAVAREALRAAETVFSAYAAEAEWVIEAGEPDPAPEGNGSGRTRVRRSAQR